MTSLIIMFVGGIIAIVSSFVIMFCSAKKSNKK